jgi:hypothetical protein
MMYSVLCTPTYNSNKVIATEIELEMKKYTSLWSVHLRA